jgi:hypothetical protein
MPWRILQAAPAQKPDPVGNEHAGSPFILRLTAFAALYRKAAKKKKATCMAEHPPAPFRSSRRLRKTLHFYAIRLPLIYALIPAGFLFEFIITFPFRVLAGLDRKSGPGRKGRR